MQNVTGMEPAPRSPILVLGHGASGSAASMAPHVAGLAARGIRARAIDLPKGRAERAVPRFADLLAADPGLAIGGHSFGGRVASLAAADACDAGRPPRSLILLSYPLHPPGRQDDWDARTAHWPRLTCPVILLSGTSDPFAGPRSPRAGSRGRSAAASARCARRSRPAVREGGAGRRAGRARAAAGPQRTNPRPRG